MICRIAIFSTIVLVFCFLSVEQVDGAVIDRSVDSGSDYPFDCTILEECGEDEQCLYLLNKIECMKAAAEKRSGYSGKRGAFKNLKKIFVNSYNTRMG